MQTLQPAIGGLDLTMPGHLKLVTVSTNHPLVEVVNFSAGLCRVFQDLSQEIAADIVGLYLEDYLIARGKSLDDSEHDWMKLLNS